MTNYRKLHRQLRRDLRVNATTAEVELWKFLKGRQIEGCKFRRQHSIGPFVLDFYCPETKLNIELDGNHHFTIDGMIADKRRDTFLKAKGIRVLRFENKLVFEELTMVLSQISKATKALK